MVEFREIKEKQEREFAQHEEAWQGRIWYQYSAMA